MPYMGHHAQKMRPPWPVEAQRSKRHQASHTSGNQISATLGLASKSRGSSAACYRFFASLTFHLAAMFVIPNERPALLG